MADTNLTAHVPANGEHTSISASAMHEITTMATYVPPYHSPIVFTDQYGGIIPIEEQVQDNIDVLDQLRSLIDNLHRDVSFMESQLMFERQDRLALIEEIKRFNLIPGGGNGSLR